MSALVHRLHAYLHASAADGLHVIRVAPFVVYLHRRDPLVHFSYAIPEGEVGGRLEESVERLRAAFRAHGRTPRLEYLEEVAPSLGRALLSEGFRLALRAPLMTCRREDFREPPAVRGLEVTRVDADADDLALAETVRMRGAAFGTGGRDAVGAAVDEMRGLLASGSGEVVARAGRGVVACASFLAPKDGLAEVGGVATAAEHRRRGIGALVVAAATLAAFDAGAEVAFLTPGDEDARRLYERVGYEAVATVLHYADKA